MIKIYVRTQKRVGGNQPLRHVNKIETMYGRSRVYVKVERRLCLRVAFHTLPTWL